MSDIFDQAFRKTIGHEGDFSDDPSDSGGATRFGITEAVARANGYAGPMYLLSYDLARQIAYAQYWRQNRLDDIAAISNPVALELFDTGYNMGVGVAAKFLQTALNALNREAKDYPDLTPDGVLGNVTIYALKAYFRVRRRDGELVLLRALNCLQGAGYIELSQRRAKDERFVFGWLLNRVAI